MITGMRPEANAGSRSASTFQKLERPPVACQNFLSSVRYFVATTASPSQNGKAITSPVALGAVSWPARLAVCTPKRTASSGSSFRLSRNCSPIGPSVKSLIEVAAFPVAMMAMPADADACDLHREAPAAGLFPQVRTLRTGGREVAPAAHSGFDIGVGEDIAGRAHQMIAELGPSSDGFGLRTRPTYSAARFLSPLVRAAAISIVDLDLGIADGLSSPPLARSRLTTKPPEFGPSTSRARRNRSVF